MIGTMYERLSACVVALAKVGVDAKHISLRGHPEAMRPFALCFDRERHPGRAKREITFLDTGGMKWRGMRVYEDGKLDPKDIVWVCIDGNYVIEVHVGGFPRVDDDCPTKYRVVADKAIRSFSPSAAS